MNKKYYLFLGLLSVVFFGVNFIIYNTSFDIPYRQTAAVIRAKPKYPSILNFGDVMFDRGVRNIMENRGRDPFEYIKKDANAIKSFDTIIANLEGPIVETDRNKCQQKAYNFQFASTTPQLLKSAGINVVNIANNHNYDCFGFGFNSTKKSLGQAGIDYVGDNSLDKSYVVKNIDGKKIALAGIDQTVPGISINDFYTLVQKLTVENDYVVVNIHWGEEYGREATNAQISVARGLIDNGADVVFGHHPHVVEPLEIYKNKVIFYSLGNFVFDQTDLDTTIGLGSGVEFRNDEYLFTLFPFNIKQFAPEFMAGPEKSEFCEKYLAGITHAGCEFKI